MNSKPFGLETLRLDAEKETQRIAERLRHDLSTDLRRRGLVIGISGGIDSSVTCGLAVRALGKNRVFGLLMPERESSNDTRRLSRELVTALGVDFLEEDITGILESVGFYKRYEDAVRKVVPQFGPGWKSKIVTSGLSEANGFTFFSLVTQSPSGDIARQRLPAPVYLEIVAATNFKQRIRKMLEYYHADRLNYAVAGTPNRLEYDQGFFVKNGDGSADVKPIAHLYKMQVYQLADHLGLPEGIRRRSPTTDTYSMPQGQDEFFFSVPAEQLDLCLYAKNHGIAAEIVAPAARLSLAQVLAVWNDIDRKRSGTHYLHAVPRLIEPMPEIAH